MSLDFFDEFPSTDQDLEGLTYDGYLQSKESHKQKVKRQKQSIILNAVPIVPPVPQEILDKRAAYNNDYVLAHTKVFPNSTGLCPLSDEQILSTRFSENFVKKRSKVIKVEPRGFGKTSRSVNEGIIGVLEGDIQYLLIMGSTIEKAYEIVDTVLTELIENEAIAELYPVLVECLKHWEQNPRRSETQTYNKKRTHISIKKGKIVLPIIEGESWSGCILQIRPKKNVRGIYHVHKVGPDAGKRIRPTHVIFDDIQTDEEAENPLTAQKIVRLLKKGVLRSGVHQVNLGVMMAATPIAPDDVTHHFLYREPWERIKYSMLKNRAENEAIWLEDYAQIRQNFNAEVPGDQIRAHHDSMLFYTQNLEEMNRGATATWEYAYNMHSVPQTEISAIQHAYNILIDEGEEVFECECQCNVQLFNLDPTITFCNQEEIERSIHRRNRKELEVREHIIVTHIDVNQPYLTFTTVASPQVFNGSCIDYGSYPAYNGIFSKKTVGTTLATTYGKHLSPEDVTYLAVKDFLNYMYDVEYLRQDGVVLRNKLILVDTRWHTKKILSAIRDSKARAIAMPAIGHRIKPGQKTFEEKSYSGGAIKFFSGICMPTSDQTMMEINYDNDIFKTQVHLGFKKEVGVSGSLSLFQDKTTTNPHNLLARHCRSERPKLEEDPKTERSKIQWHEVAGQENEYFDNLTGSLAGLAYLNVKFETNTSIIECPVDIQKFMEDQYTN